MPNFPLLSSQHTCVIIHFLIFLFHHFYSFPSFNHNFYQYSLGYFYSLPPPFPPCTRTLIGFEMWPGKVIEYLSYSHILLPSPPFTLLTNINRFWNVTRQNIGLPQLPLSLQSIGHILTTKLYFGNFVTLLQIDHIGWCDWSKVPLKLHTFFFYLERSYFALFYFQSCTS